MTYDASSLNAYDNPIELIQQRPEMFVGAAGAHPQRLALRLAGDALELGANQVEIHRSGDWWIVASDDDWLAYHNRHDVLETFNRILPIPGLVNSCRSEVVVHALADAVFTSKCGELVVLRGCEEAIHDLLAHVPFYKRIVGFTMARPEDEALFH